MCDLLQVVPFPAVGAEVMGLNLTAQPLSDECRSKILSIWNKHQVLLFRNQNLTEESILSFAEAFGTPKPAGSRGYYLREGNPHGSGRASPIPQVSVMSNLDADGKPLPVTGGHGSQAVDWHQDDSYTNAPAQGALLYNTIHPAPNPFPSGNTSFCDLYGAFESLPLDLQRKIERMHLVHDVSRNSAGHVRPGLTLPDTFDDVLGPAHPIVITHPLTGRKALHLGRKQPAPTSYIQEMPNEEGHELFDFLWQHAIDESRVWTHNSWRPGDLVIWDNLATMHARSTVDETQRREMLRVLLRGPSQGLVGTAIVNGTILKTVPTNANDKADAEAAAKAARSNATWHAPDVEDTLNGTCEASENRLGSQLGLPSMAASFGRTIPADALLSLAMVLAIALSVMRKRSRIPSDNKGKTGIDAKINVSAMTPSQRYLNETRVHVFWVSFLFIYLFFQSFSCGRADRLWRISDIYNVSPKVLLKPFGLSFFWFEVLAPLIRFVENAVLVCMLALAVPPKLLPSLPRRVLVFICGLGWLYLHGYEHSLTGGSHTHLMPAICMMALALPPAQSVTVIRWWNMFLLFSAGLCKLFNGDHHPWWAWMDGQSMQFYFVNSRQPVPEPWNTWTMENDWFASLQCTGSVIFELSAFLLFWQPYRLVFPLLGAGFHGVIWYTLGVNYLTSIIIQFTLVLDASDWHCIGAILLGDSRRNQVISITEPAMNKEAAKSGSCSSVSFLTRAIVIMNPLILSTVIVKQIEFWPLSNIPMYSGYRPRAGYNSTHIANRKYLDDLINECAPHVWSRHWTDVVIQDLATGERSKMSFCVPSPLFNKMRGVKEFCLVPERRLFDTERGDIVESSSYRLAPPGNANGTFKHAVRVGGWNRQKPIVVMAELPGRHHVYCQHEFLSPAQDWLYRNCAFLKSFPQLANRTLRAALVVHLGTGDVEVGAVNCDDYVYAVDRVPPCVQSPWY